LALAGPERQPDSKLLPPRLDKMNDEREHAANCQNQRHESESGEHPGCQALLAEVGVEQSARSDHVHERRVWEGGGQQAFD
jgi:hypothetical protein